MKILPDLKFSDLEMNVFQFTDFNVLLDAYFERCKNKDRRYSMRYFSQRFGSKSPNFIQSLLEGKQKISESIFTDLVEILSLEGPDFDYFESLYRLKQYPEGSSLYERYYRRFRELRFKKPISLVETQHDCITSWFIWLIREMASLEGAHYNPMWFKKKLSPIIDKGVGDISAALDLLIKAELLEEQDGKFSLSEPLKEISASDPRLKLLHKELIEMSLKFLKDSSKNREFGAFAIATTPEKFDKMRQELKDFLNYQFRALETPPGEGSMVVSYSFQLFTLAQS